MARKYIGAALLIYGLANATLYSSLLPLWEGFDEEFHYGYVQYLGAHHRFPVLNQTGLSLEINRSIGLLPMSYIMIRNVNLQGVRTFDRYFALDSATRHRLYDEAQAIPTELRLSESTQYYTNYEVHHAPLAYLLMAVPDTLLSNAPMMRRVWLLRWMAGSACVVLMFLGLRALGAEAGLAAWFTAVLTFLIFSCQMFWATVAHIGNDWLSVPLTVWTMVWAMRCERAPSMRNAVWLALVFGLGLLSKAYFLVFLPLYLMAAAWWFYRRRLGTGALAALLSIPAVLAGPWYLRNVILYHNISARVEESSGVTTGRALQSLLSIPWLKSLPFMARGTFWLGNSMFTDFSVLTMDAVLLLLAVGLVLYVRRRPTRWDGIWLWLPVGLFCAAMIYVVGSGYVYTKGEMKVASPWYLQAVLPALVLLALEGCQWSGRWGGWLARGMVVLWGYVLAATYVAKLFPLYGGFSGGRSTLRDIGRWYATDWARTSDILSTTSMVTAPWLLAMLAVVLAALAASMGLLLPAQGVESPHEEMADSRLRGGRAGGGRIGDHPAA